MRARALAAWAWRPAAIAVVSRIFSIALIAVLNEWRRTPVRNPFALWDGEWYLRIVNDGYHGAPVKFHPTIGTAWHDFAFFPGWPAAVKGAWIASSPLDLGPGAVGFALANVLFVAGAVIAWRAIADRMGPWAATTGIALLSFAPSAYAFSMVYSESLFIVLAAGAYAVRGTVARGVLTGLATLTRVTGVAIIASALVEAWFGRGRDRRVALATALGGVTALAVWWGFAAWLTGDPAGYLRGSAGWNPNSGIAQLAKVVAEPSWQQVGWVAFTGFAVWAAVLLVRRNRELGVYSLASLALLLLPGSASHSWSRYALAAFPIFAALGERLGPRAATALVVAFAVLQVVFAAWTIPSTSTAP